MTVLLRFYYDYTTMELLFYYGGTMIVLPWSTIPLYYGWIPRSIMPGSCAGVHTMRGTRLHHGERVHSDCQNYTLN